MARPWSLQIGSSLENSVPHTSKRPNAIDIRAPYPGAPYSGARVARKAPFGATRPLSGFVFVREHEHEHEYEDVHEYEHEYEEDRF